MKKTIVSMCIIALSVFAGNASALVFVGHLGGGDGSWAGAGNWTLDDVATLSPAPTSSDLARAINLPGYGVTVNAAGAVANQVEVGTWANNGTLTTTSAGALAVNYDIILAYSTGETGILNNDGAISVGRNLYVGGSAGAGAGVLNMNGGTLNVVGTIDVSTGTGTSHINLHGGTITAYYVNFIGSALDTMDITEGTLIMTNGDDTAGVDWLAGQDLITAYGGTGTVMSSYEAGVGTTVWAEVPEPATMLLLGLGGLLLRKKR